MLPQDETVPHPSHRLFSPPAAWPRIPQSFLTSLRYDEAVAACTSALEEDPSCDQALLLRARCSFEAGEQAAAYRLTAGGATPASEPGLAETSARCWRRDQGWRKPWTR
eukprot:764670-Hanusia_phi.AAC.5